MAELKTQPNDLSAEEFIEAVKPEWKKEDCQVILQLMRKVTQLEPKMWGNSIVGFGSYHYTYESGREGDWFLTGFSPRKQNMTVYLIGGYQDSNSLLSDLGKHKTSVGCLYFKKLSDIDVAVLEKLIVQSVEKLKQTYPYQH